MKEALKNFFTQYSSEKLLALLLTLILWTFSISRNQESRDYPVKVNIIHPKDQIIVSDTIDQIQVKLSGSVFDFAKINDRDFVINIDISAKKPGKFTRLLDAKMMTFTGNLSVEKIFPAEISVRTAKKIERKVKIDPWLDGQPPAGSKIKGYKVTPKKVTIAGPEKEISEIDSVTTEKIVLDTLKGSFEKELKLVLPSIHISTVETDKATVTITLEKEAKTIDADEPKSEDRVKAKKGEK
ncbi:MAG TPA: CdaR family protein [bacterium]|nr:CdaR family protein [bacterium]